MDQKVSIIVPVYGVEKYLDECVQSLLAQSYGNLEIILIDDGGKDRCPEICDRYAAEDDRILAIHKPNGGAASARNAGVDAATGQYICFVDGDDSVEPDYVQHLLTTATGQNADMAVCGFYNQTRSGAAAEPMTDCGSFTQQEFLLRFLKDWSCSLLWNKIFRREVIGDIRMAEGHKIDDEFFTYLVVMNCKNIVVTDRPLYLYRIRGSSVMQATGPHLERIMLDRIEYITTRYRNIQAKLPELAPAFLQDTVDTMVRYWYHSKAMPNAQKEIRRWVNRRRSAIMKLALPLRQKLIYLYQFYFVKPALTAEPNPIQLDAAEYFD